MNERVLGLKPKEWNGMDSELYDLLKKKIGAADESIYAFIEQKILTMEKARRVIDPNIPILSVLKLDVGQWVELCRCICPPPAAAAVPK